jgi:uncharacterized membrane protein
MSGGEHQVFVGSWIAVVFLGLTALTILWQIRAQWRNARGARMRGES